jgi:hypothetical protein
VEVQLLVFLNWTLNRGEGLTLRPGLFIPRDRIPVWLQSRPRRFRVEKKIYFFICGIPVVFVIINGSI